MVPHPPSEIMALSDPSTGWTALPAGFVLAAFALPFVPVVMLLRALGLVSWTIEARCYPWGRRHPPIVFSYAVRHREHATAAMSELAAELARGKGNPVLSRAQRIL
jgi:hypothetical protein